METTGCGHVLEQAPFGLFVFDLDGDDRLIVAAANTAALRFSGQDASSLLGKSLEEAFPGLIDTEIPDRYRRAARDGISWTADKVRYEHAGHSGTYEVHAFQVRPGQVAVMFLDVTSRWRADELLRQEETRHQLLLRLTSEVVWAAHASGSISYVSAAADWLTELAPTQIAGKPLSSLLGEEVSSKVVDLMAKTRADPNRPRTTTIHATHAAPNSVEVHIEVTATVIVATEGDVIGVQGTARNVTAQKNAQLLSERLRLRNQMLLDAAGEGIFGLDRRGRFTFANPAAADLLGFPTGELIGCHCSIITVGAGDDLPLPTKEAQPLPAAWYRDAPTRVENAFFRRREGATICVDYVARPIKAVGEPTGLVVVFDDVTERRQAEAQLERLGMAIEQSSEVVLITDASGTIIYANPAFERVTGYTCEEALGRTPAMLKSGKHDKSFYEHLWATIRDGDTWAGRVVNRRKDGQLYTEEATISPVRDADGTIISFVAVKRDVTKEVALAEQLMQSQKMQAIGLLAGGVAHDMNNILATVMVTATLMEAALPDDHGCRADLDVIFNACRRGRDLAGNLLGFSGKGAFVRGPLDLNKVARDTVAFLERSLLRRIDLKTDLQLNLPVIEGDPSQISQAVMNLCINAADAIEGRGVIRISTSVAEGRETGAEQHDGGRWVLLQVQDSGIGMNEETLARVFEPFFTTKPPEKGTGLGLSMIYGTMTSSGGQVDIESRLGEGTTVTLRFPELENATFTSEPPPSVRQATTSAKGGVLLIDDEPALLASMAKMLRMHGYEVWEASSGDVGLDEYCAQAGRIDVVVLDLIMPDMDGAQVIERLREVDPSVRVLVSSGFAEDDSVERALACGASEFLPKPFEFDALLDRLESILGRTA